MYERHGHATDGLTRLYKAWQAMRYRCSGRKIKCLRTYTERGISICDEWRQSFEPFRVWALANGYADGLTLDRIDTFGNYEPSNCRWVTMQVQAENRSNNCMVEVDGKTQTIAAWAKETGMHLTTLYRRYSYGMRGYDVISPSTQALRKSIMAEMTPTQPTGE
jgi:hypothetical protein